MPSKGFASMGVTFSKVQVAAKTHALRADYTEEFVSDFKSVLGGDAESTLANILAEELVGEQNRMLIEGIYYMARTVAPFDVAAQVAAGGFGGPVTAPIGFFARNATDVYKNLILRIEMEANQIAKWTRRGRGNFIIVDSNTASAIKATGLLSYSQEQKLEIDDVGNTYAGQLNGSIAVYIDPYWVGNDGNGQVVIGYKGSNDYDAGAFYCPYIAAQTYVARDPQTFQPTIGLKSRFDLVANPLVLTDANTDPNEIIPGSLGVAGGNYYFSKFAVLGVGQI
jgi:hypothetical protein